MNPLIELKNVHKSFGSLTVLAGVDLKVYPGQTTVVLGESGTGKSVLLKSIIALMKPDEGTVVFDGVDVTALSERDLAPIRRRFGFLFQGGALFDSLSARENVAFPLRQHTRLSDAEIRKMATSKLRQVGLEDVADQIPGQLSGGQKKRVALARAIAMDPQVILYDEPTTGLDPIRADVINELILKLQRQLAVTSIVVTHDLTSAYKVGNRMLLLAEGRFIFDGTADDLRKCEDEQVARFVAGRASEEELDALGIT